MKCTPKVGNNFWRYTFFMKISRNVIFAALVSATIFAGCASTKQKVVSVVAPIISSDDLRLALEPKISSDGLSAEKYYLLATDGNGKTFDGTSCYKLGTYYEEGRAGVTQDFSKAAAYYLKAVSDPNTHATMLGTPQAYYSLARFYENGLGVEKDSAKTKSYYEKALSACEETLSYEFAAGREATKVTQEMAKEALERF